MEYLLKNKKEIVVGVVPDMQDPDSFVSHLNIIGEGVDDNIPYSYEINKDYKKIPDTIQSWQFHSALEIYGMSDLLEGAINSLTEPTKTVVENKLKYATTYSMSEPTVIALASILQIPQDKLDEMWLFASELD